ncbi:MAG: glycosyltransferase family 39 protein [Anaerolineales bacterium]
MKADDLEQDHTAGQPVSLPHASLRGLSMSGVAVNQLILVMALTLGVFLRLWQINLLGYNSDEAVYAGQAAAIAQDPALKEIFPIFRAHPLLFQFTLALVFHFGVSDLLGRLVAVVISSATVFIVYRLGSLLYGQKAGILAALFLALMPYHVVISRQVLLDGPLVFCTTLTLYLLALFAKTEHPAWLHATGVGMGLVVLSKETGIILIGAIYAFLALSREIRLRILDLVIATILTTLMIAAFPLSLLLAGGTKSGKQYLVWQLFRRPNHTWDFYPTTVPIAMGILVIVVALFGLWVMRHQRTWRERLLICWILVPTVFFQLWPTKGFQYLLPIAPAVAILAGRTLACWSPAAEIRFRRWRLSNAWVRALAAGIVALSLLIPSWQVTQPSTTGTFIAGTGGVPGGREAGIWVRENIPQGAILLSIGPSMANIIQFYGHRKVYGLSVSPNPLRRNPSYTAVPNPDLQIQNGDLQYIVWDSFSAERSSFFSERLLRFTQRYRARVIHTESVMVKLEDGSMVAKPVIIIYEVRP